MDNNASWLEVSLLVDGEMAEAVAEVLGRYVSGGVLIESTEIAAEAGGEGYPVGLLRVCGYLPIDEQLEHNRRRLEEALWHLGRIQPLPDAAYKTIAEANWVNSWKAHYHPVAVGERLMIVPAWLEAPDPERIAVRIDPGMAFGTGTHPTTQLCLEILEDLICAMAAGGKLEPPGNKRVDLIDVGCGSGILSIAALKLGVSRVIGVDIDQAALVAARENAALNNVSGCLELDLGSVMEVRAGSYSFQRAPLVVANILAPVLLRLFKEGLGDLLTPGGKLVLSGILEEQETEVCRAVEDCGLALVSRRQKDDWVAIVTATQ